MRVLKHTTIYFVFIRMVDLYPSNLNPNTNDTMGAMISTTLNTDPLTYSDVRPRLNSNNSSRCPELNSGPHLKDTFTPRKSSRNVRRQNMVLNIERYKKWVRKCRKQATYRHNLQILCINSILAVIYLTKLQRDFMSR